MKTAHLTAGTTYAFGYAKGRQAAKELASAKDNPFRPGTSSFHGWNDGHYDERSARSVAVSRHSALIWSGEAS